MKHQSVNNYLNAIHETCNSKTYQNNTVKKLSKSERKIRRYHIFAISIIRITEICKTGPFDKLIEYEIKARVYLALIYLFQ